MAEYEQDHQRSRRSHAENEMGKNYLLEAYLNGLPDGKNENTANSCGNRNNNNNKNDDGNEIDKEITTPGNSDSGVNTEEIATSPEIGTQSPLTNDSGTNSIDNNNDDTKKVANLMDSTALTTICKRLSIREKPPKKQSTRKLNEKMTRETKLIMEHVNRKEFCAKMEKERLTENQTDGMVSQSKPLNVDDHLAGQIELLEKVIAINKHIQHEEELLVRLNAKMRKYEIDDPNLTETEMKVVLNQLNTNIESSKNELVKTEHELNESTEMLENKSKIVKELSKELAALELNERKSNENQQCLIQVPSHQIQIHANNCEPHDIPQQQPLQNTINNSTATKFTNTNFKCTFDIKSNDITIINDNDDDDAISTEETHKNWNITKTDFVGTKENHTNQCEKYILRYNTKTATMQSNHRYKH